MDNRIANRSISARSTLDGTHLSELLFDKHHADLKQTLSAAAASACAAGLRLLQSRRRSITGAFGYTREAQALIAKPEVAKTNKLRVQNGLSRREQALLVRELPGAPSTSESFGN